MLRTDGSLRLLPKLLDASAANHKVIANNIANFNTPGYQKLEMHFDAELRRAMRTGGVERAMKVPFEIRVSDDKPLRNDGNNVDLEKEFGHLTKNTLGYNAYARILSKKLSMLKAAISGRSR